MNADGTNKVLVSSVSPSTTYPSWPPDGSKTAFTSGDQALYIINSNGTGLSKLLDNAVHPSRSPDGKMLTFTRYNNTASEMQIHVIKVDGSNLVNLGVEGANPDWGVNSSIVLPPPQTNDAPVIVTGTVDRTPDMNGYYNHASVITWNGSDPDGMASCDPQVEYSDPDSPPASTGEDNSLTLTGH